MIVRSRRVLHIVLSVLLAVMAAASVASPVSAHTDFESSSPADGSVMTSPISEIVITFTAAATPAGDGFQVLEPSGQLREPSDVLVDDDRIFRLAFDPPLAGGVIGVRWSVRAGDAHPIAGSFSFTVDAPVPTVASEDTSSSSPAVTSTITSTTVVDESSSDDETLTTVDSSGPSATSSPATSSSATDPADDQRDTVDLAASADQTGEPSPPAATETAALADFLDVAGEPDGAGIARIGRIIGFLGVVLTLGTLAFASAVLVGSQREVHAVLRAAQLLAIALAVGAAIEYVGVSRLLDESLGSGWSTSAGFATALRLLGGLAIAAGAWAASTARATRTASTATSLSAAVVTDDATLTSSSDHHVRTRWRPDRRSMPVAAGVVAVLASFWFDGHTVTKGFRPLHALANSVHVAAGAIWVGGVASLAVVAWVRHRRGTPSRFGELVVRFSSIATVALIAVAIAGALMTVMILDSFGELTSTDWGQLMLLKLAAVAIAVAFGAYNHLRLRPALDAEPDDPRLLVVVRNVLTAEAIVLTFVVVVTAWLVAAAS